MRSRLLPTMLSLLCAGTLWAVGLPVLAAPESGAPPVEVDAPTLSHHGRVVTITLRAEPFGEDAVRFEIRNAAGTVVTDGELEPGSELPVELPAAIGSGSYELTLPGSYEESVSFEIRSIPGWLSVAPALLAIALALAFRQVVPALLAGIWVGAWIFNGSALIGMLRSIDHYIVGSLTDPDHVKIVIFSLLLGGMVGVISKAGGMVGLVEALTPYATTTRRGQLVTWLLGILIFFDDYANTLIVGNTMRPVTDRLRISREKLAYVVDSTAAPVASIAVVTTWIGYEVSLIGDSLPADSGLDAYGVFLRSLPYNFYPILALVFGLMIAWSGRDFGAMLRAERRARGGKLLADSAVPLSDFDGEALSPPPGKPRRWINAVLPVSLVLAVTFIALWWTGRSALAAAGDPLGSASLTGLGLRGIGAVFGEGASFDALLYASMSGCVAALGLAMSQRLLSLGAGIQALADGIKSMTMAIIILVLAWGIGDICADLDTSGFMIANLAGLLDPRLFSTLVFLIASATAFATGTSWATMAILIPLAVPTAFGLSEAAGLDPVAAQIVLLGAVSAVLAGAIFGDHCSPISDTTVMSSMASGCDHMDHVRTQLPYALAVAGVAVVLGYLPSGFGLPPLLCLVLGAGALFGLLRWRGAASGD